MAMGHVILREYHLNWQAPYFEDYCRRYSDMPMLVKLVGKDGAFVPDRLLRASDFKGGLGEKNNPEWKTVAIDDASGKPVTPVGSAGFRWGEQGKWNLEEKDGGRSVTLRMTFILDDEHDAVVDVPSPISAIASMTISRAPIIPMCSTAACRSVRSD
jgi:nitrate reductase alpha subunit